MRLAVISHKICWKSHESPTGYATDGGFPLQIEAISGLFTSTEIVVPCHEKGEMEGLSDLKGRRMSVRPLSIPAGTGLSRKIDMIRWTILNGPSIWRAVRKADAVHAPIPGDVGTIGMVIALLLRKPLFVRHCGNWLAPRTTAEKIWKWSMERLAGGRNVMMATGGSQESPSAKNPAVSWIFSTSLSNRQLADATPRALPKELGPRLLIACRQEAKKGTDVVLLALKEISSEFRGATLDVVGGGSMLERYRKLAESYGVAERVVFHGRVEQSKVVELMKDAHLFCFPTTASEGFPKVVLEAMASGLPVITTNVSVLPNLVGRGCGVILEEPKPESLSTAVRDIIRKPDVYHSMSQKAIETAREYSLERWRDAIGHTLKESWEIDDLDLAKSLRGRRAHS